MRKKLVSGHVLYTDSTHIKASANKNKHLQVTVKQERQAYMDQLDRAVEEERISHGKKPLAPPSKAPSEKTIKQSTTDPDSGYMVRDQKPKGFFYLDHRTVDGKANIITDVRYFLPKRTRQRAVYREAGTPAKTLWLQHKSGGSGRGLQLRRDL